MASKGRVVLNAVKNTTKKKGVIAGVKAGAKATAGYAQKGINSAKATLATNRSAGAKIKAAGASAKADAAEMPRALRGKSVASAKRQAYQGLTAEEKKAVDSVRKAKKIGAGAVGVAAVGTAGGVAVSKKKKKSK
jgi:hypothetical protein